MPSGVARFDRAAAACLLAAALAAAGCSTTASMLPPAGESIGSDVDDLEPASLALAAERTVAALETRDSAAPFTIGGRAFTTADLVASARRVAEIARSEKTAEGLTRALTRDCRAWRVPDAAKVTAYYEPRLAARRQPDSRFRYALYRQPSPSQLDALRRKLGHVPTRADIDGRGVLGGLGLELAWVDDPVARFFLHVQGSGRLVFEDGRDARVGFAGSNDLPYRSVGAAMIAGGLLQPDNASAPAMRAWLSSHADRRDSLLELNPRYVFFRETGAAGAVGSLGATLVPGRSIAADDEFVPRGVLAWLRTTKPTVGEDGHVRGEKTLVRFVFAQDAGAAIRGPARVDLFVGSGEKAGEEAGVMNQRGELSLLVCRDGSARRAASLGPPLRPVMRLP